MNTDSLPGEFLIMVFKLLILFYQLIFQKDKPYWEYLKKVENEVYLFQSKGEDKENIFNKKRGLRNVEAVCGIKC